MSNVLLDSVIEHRTISRFRSFGENYVRSYVKSAKNKWERTECRNFVVRIFGFPFWSKYVLNSAVEHLWM